MSEDPVCHIQQRVWHAVTHSTCVLNKWRQCWGHIILITIFSLGKHWWGDKAKHGTGAEMGEAKEKKGRMVSLLSWTETKVVKSKKKKVWSNWPIANCTLFLPLPHSSHLSLQDPIIDFYFLKLILSFHLINFSHCSTITLSVFTDNTVYVLSLAIRNSAVFNSYRL